MRDVQIVRAEKHHAAALALLLRAGDQRELEIAGCGPNREIWRCFRRSIFSKAALVDGELAALWGMSGSPLMRVGKPWLLTAPPVERAKVTFIRQVRREIADMLDICPVLQGLVDDGYERAVKMLRHIGFDVGEPFPFGPWGAPFREYRLER